MKKIIMASALVVGVLGFGASTASAQDAQSPGVRICHWDDDDEALKSITPASQGALNGHTNHEQDIIPPFTGFAGQNWDAAGQATWNNDCVVPADTTTTTELTTTTTELTTTTSELTTTTSELTTTTSELTTTTTEDHPTTTSATTAPPAAVTLPETGSDTTVMAILAALMTALGGAAIFASRRRSALD